MNGSHKQKLERYFDCELSPSERAALRTELAEDTDAAQYLDQLALLRKLACAHDPVPRAAASRIPFELIGDGKSPRSRRLAFVALAAAASVAALLAIPRVRTNPGTVAPFRVATPRSLNVPPAVTTHTGSAAPLEVELIRLANAPARGPERAVRAFWSRLSPSQRRSESREILALEIANGSPRPPMALLRATVSPSGPTASPNRRRVLPHRPHAPSARRT